MILYIYRLSPVTSERAKIYMYNTHTQKRVSKVWGPAHTAASWVLWSLSARDRVSFPAALLLFSLSCARLAQPQDCIPSISGVSPPIAAHALALLSCSAARRERGPQCAYSPKCNRRRAENALLRSPFSHTHTHQPSKLETRARCNARAPRARLCSTSRLSLSLSPHVNQTLLSSAPQLYNGF